MPTPRLGASVMLRVASLTLTAVSTVRHGEQVDHPGRRCHSDSSKALRADFETSETVRRNGQACLMSLLMRMLMKADENQIEDVEPLG